MNSEGPQGAAAAVDLDEGYDPFAAFDTAMGAATVEDPYPQFAELRRTAPVHRGKIAELLGVRGLVMDAGSDLLFPDVTEWFSAMSFDAVTQVLRDGQTFSSAGYGRSIGLVVGHSIFDMDDPEHKRYRALIEQGFTKKALSSWGSKLIPPIVDRLVSAFAGRGRADLVREFTYLFPVQVIAAILGLQEEDTERFHRWTVALLNVSADPERGLIASQRLQDYLVDIIERRRSVPADDLISDLVTAELDGHRLTNEEIVAFLRFLLPAGAETTSRSSANLLVGLLTHPEQLHAVRADRSLVPQAVEEGLRWETPLVVLYRWATRGADIAGTPIPGGAGIAVCVGSANRDEKRWESSQVFDVERKPIPNVSFAHGPHVCLGMHVARLETAVALNALLDRLPNIRLDPEADEPRITGLVLRSPRSIPVLFEGRS
jgi:cytochrome P450